MYRAEIFQYFLEKLGKVNPEMEKCAIQIMMYSSCVLFYFIFLTFIKMSSPRRGGGGGVIQENIHPCYYSEGTQIIISIKQFF